MMMMVMIVLFRVKRICTSGKTACKNVIGSSQPGETAIYTGKKLQVRLLIYFSRKHLAKCQNLFPAHLSCSPATSESGTREKLKSCHAV